MNLSRVRNRTQLALTVLAASSTTTTTSFTRALNTQNSCGIDMASSSPTIKVIPSDKLYTSEPNPRWFGNPINPGFDPAWTNTNWLKSRFHFNFAEYHNPQNPSFGVLRVLNDDLVQPKRGFGAHPHRDMEIFTYIVEGKLTHRDSTGNQETLGRGSVQFMTAGTGIEHSEHNHHEVPLRFVQVWITPRKRGLAPNYGSYDFGADTDAERTQRNTLRHLATDAASDAKTPIALNQDVDCFAAELETGKSVSFDIPAGRQAYLLCVEGSLGLNGGKVLARHDAAELFGTGGSTTVEVTATQTEETEGGNLAHLLLFVMKEAPGSGRRDLA